MPLDGHHPAQDLAWKDDIGKVKRVTFAHEPLPIPLDHSVEEQPPRRYLITYHIAHEDLGVGGRTYQDHIAVQDEGDHAPAPGLDPEGLSPSQKLAGKLLDRLQCCQATNGGIGGIST